MSALAWAYLSGAAVTLLIALLLAGRPRSLADACAVVAFVALWPAAWVMAALESLGDVQPPW